VPRQVGDREIEVVLGHGDQPGAGFGGQAVVRVPRAIEVGLPGLLEHRVVDGLLGGEMRVQRGLLHAYPAGDVTQGQPGDAGLVRGIPGRVENLPPDSLMAFGSPITIRFYYHRAIISQR
jgi:hypothetical protein